MRAGESRLGPLRIAWSVPAESASDGGLRYLADAPAPRSATFTVLEAAPDTLRGPPDAFFGDVLVQVHPDHVTIASPVASFEVYRDAVRGRARGSAALASALALHALAAHHGLVHVHGALVSLEGRTVLAPGGSGAGKTSLALAVSKGGGELASDDVTYVDADGVGWPVRRPPHVSAETRRLHPDLRELGPVLDGVVEKVRLESPMLGPASPSRIDAVVLPCIEPVPLTRIERIEPSQVFALLLHASAFAMIEGSPERDRQIDSLARLAERPVISLVAGRDALADPQVLTRTLKDWLARIDAAPASARG